MKNVRLGTHRFAALACAVLACTVSLVPAGARQGDPVPFAITHGPYLQLPSATSMTVVWHTNKPAVSKVEYWPATGAAVPDVSQGSGTSHRPDPSQAPDRVMTAISAAHGLIDNDRTSHVIRLGGLRPGTTYQYRVISREFQGYEKQHIVKYGETVSGEAYSFTTLLPMTGAAKPAGAYSFPVFSDIHENSKRLDAMLAKIDWSVTPFVVFNGDMVNDFMNVDQPFTGFVDVSVSRLRSPADDRASARQAPIQTIPFIYIRGNHDVRGRYARRLTDYFPAYVPGGALRSPSGQASSAPAGAAGARAYYSFDHGPVHFIVLDSGEDKVDSHEYYNGLVAFEPYRREQAAWLAEDLRSASARRARYRIVFSHIPPYDGSARTGTPAEGFAIQQVRECWEKVANAGGVNLWLSGHTHRVAYIEPAGLRRQNSATAAAATAGDRAPANRYHLVIGAPDTFTRVDVTPAKLTVTVTRETGETVRTFTVR